MKQPMGTPEVVSKRNEFVSSQLMVEDAMQGLPEQYRSDSFAAWLKRYTDQVIMQVDHAFAVGAENGVKQVSVLLRNPDYYVTLKERRKREFQRQRDYAAKQELDRLERKLCPTREQLDQRIKTLEEWIPKDKAQVAAMEAELERLKATNPRNLRMELRPQ